MREILFRGKPVASNASYFVKNPDVIKDGFIYGDLSAMDSTGVCSITPIDIPRDQILRPSFKVIPETVGQFTGLYDANGTKIFEGDVIQSTGRWSLYNREKYTIVRWENSSCGFEPFSDSEENCGHCGGGEDPNFVEVIGNIHDNPELVGGK